MPRNDAIRIRCTVAEKAAWAQAAGSKGISAWLRDLANTAVRVRSTIASENIPTGFDQSLSLMGMAHGYPVPPRLAEEQDAALDTPRDTITPSSQADAMARIRAMRNR